MKHIKKYETFLEKKWILGINENIFDKIESLVKGKSNSGKIISEFLTKNGIKETGTAYSILYLGGGNPGKSELSHPFDYLNYTPGIAKITEDGVLVLNDEKSKSLKTPDTLSFLAIIEKDDIVKNWTFGLKQGCSVNKNDYIFDLTKDIPTLTLKKSMWSMLKQSWIKGEDEIAELDNDITEIKEEDTISFKTPMNMITLQQWVDKLNETGWVKKDTEYFKEYIK
jgi:hypothetical protein